MKLLFIAYHFPPIGGAGAQRSAKFARYLPEFGVTPVVVAGPTGASSRWEPNDASQVAELPDGTVVYRPTEPPPDLAHQSRVHQIVGAPMPRDRWWCDQIARLGHAAGRDHRLDAILITLLPYEGLVAAVSLAERLALPLVADLRDPWALDEVRLYLSRVHRAADLRRMGKLLQHCALVVLNTAEAANAVAEAFPALTDRVVTVPNGYDASDFEESAPRAPDGRFRIVHTGYLHTAIALAQRRHPQLKRMLGGALWPIDLLGRSHFYLLKAIESLHLTNPPVARTIDLVLAGVLSDEDRGVIAASAVKDQVQIRGYVDHAAAIAEMAAADALFLPMHGIPANRRARIVPGKTYEYLASGRPLLAALPASDARDMVLQMEAGQVADPSDVTGLALAISRLAADPPPHRQVTVGLDEFERRRLTERLAENLLKL